MTTSTRRTFFIQSAVAVGAAGVMSMAQAQATVEESDPQAVALGYKADATKVDKSKYPKYAAGEHCGNCALFQGKPTDSAGPCPLFAGKQVSTKGWCSAWAKKG